MNEAEALLRKLFRFGVGVSDAIGDAPTLAA